VSDQDQAVLLAEAAQVESEADDVGESDDESQARSSAAKPAARAGQRNRIPSYE
jgi:hypothetical protein